ncbi:TlpA family protein disulfide reductase [Virgibacillus xinjiangensis]|uniref:TlpA family protein disulfide reductase n=1 Tax=Virgibacillus xinjiangensis TaxID=393090 RepID=A0ABV7CVF9_9BACI
MRNGIIIMVLMVGMVGWAVYDFAFSGQEAAEEENLAESDMTTTTTGQADVEEKDEEGVLPGYMAPDFELTTLEGDTVKLSDYRGKRVMLNFWATWCPPCRDEMPDMQKLYDNKEVEVLAVDLLDTEKNKSDVADFVEELKLSFPILLDETSEVADEYKVQAYPTTYMIDSEGRIQSRMMGAMNYDMMVERLEEME